MATNFYFNNYNATNEQELAEQLVAEALSMYGMDLFYVRRDVINSDQVIVDDRYSIFTKAFPIDMYLRSVDGFGGDGQFLSKFDIEIRDQIVMSVANRTFKNEVTDSDPNLVRPREGDLLYFPLNDRLFEIKYVDKKVLFYQFGALQAFDLTCEVYEYNNEMFNTGFDQIDNIGKLYMRDNANTYPISIDQADPLARNDAIQTEANTIIDFTEKDPFSENGTY